MVLIECRKTKAKVSNQADYKGQRQYGVPIKTRITDKGGKTCARVASFAAVFGDIGFINSVNWVDNVNWPP